jgi:hypothetical protein
MTVAVERRGDASRGAEKRPEARRRVRRALSRLANATRGEYYNRRASIVLSHALQYTTTPRAFVILPPDPTMTTITSTLVDEMTRY